MASLSSRKPPPPPSANIRQDLQSTDTTAQLRRALMGELDSIVLKALDIDPKKRYDTAAGLASDLDRFLSGLPVTAHRANAAHRGVKLIKRQRAMAAMLAIFIAVSGVAIWQWFSVRNAGDAIAAHENSLRSLLDQLEAEATPVLQTRESIDRQIANLNKFRKALQTDVVPLAARSPESKATAAVLLKRGVEYLDRFQAGGTVDPRLGLELADTYRQLGTLQESTLPRSSASNTIIIHTYQKAVVILVKIGPSFQDAALIETRLSAINLRIHALSASTDTSTIEASYRPPPRTPVRPPQNLAPPPEPAQADRAVRATAVVPEELEERFLTVLSRVQLAQHSIEPVRLTLESKGQALSPAITANVQRMVGSIESARRQMDSGKAAAAAASLDAADAFATRVLQAVGR